MMCPFRTKTVTKDNGDFEENKVTKETEYMKCYEYSCPYYTGINKCKKVEAELKDGKSR